jgi:hypothetical protein
MIYIYISLNNRSIPRKLGFDCIRQANVRMYQLSMTKIGRGVLLGSGCQVALIVL